MLNVIVGFYAYLQCNSQHNPYKKMNKIKEYALICAECGSNDITMQCDVSIKTAIITDNALYNEQCLTFCEDCGDECETLTLEITKNENSNKR